MTLDQYWGRKLHFSVAKHLQYNPLGELVYHPYIAISILICYWQAQTVLCWATWWKWSQYRQPLPFAWSSLFVIVLLRGEIVQCLWTPKDRQYRAATGPMLYHPNIYRQSSSVGHRAIAVRTGTPQKVTALSPSSPLARDTITNGPARVKGTEKILLLVCSHRFHHVVKRW